MNRKYAWLKRDDATATRLRGFFGLSESWEWSECDLHVGYDEPPSITLRFIPSEDQLREFIAITTGDPS